MRIEDILKENQEKVYNKLKVKMKREKEKEKEKEKLTEKDLKELMKHSSYRRGSGGAIRQVR